MFLVLCLMVTLVGGDQREPKILIAQSIGTYYTENPVEEFTPVVTKRDDDLSLAGKMVVTNICAHLNALMYKPIAVLVQDDDGVLRDAKTYLNRIIKNTRSELWLMKFNATGVSNVLAKISTNDDVLESFKIEDGKSRLGGVEDEGGAVFFGMLKAVRLLPFGGGILIFTDRKIGDEELGQLAINEANKKQIRVFTVWQGLYPTLHSEDSLIREVSHLSHGNFFVGNTERKLSSLYYDFYFQQKDNTKTEPIVAHETNVEGRNVLLVPIDAGITKIHISLSTGVARAYLTSPAGYQIDLLNVSDVGKFSRGSYIVKVGEIYEIALNTAQNLPTPVIGMWRLETDADTAFAQTYNITIAVQNNLVVNTRIVEAKPDNTKKLRIDLQGDFTKISNITLRNNFGAPIKTRLQYNLQNLQNEEIETINEKEIDISLDNLPQEPVYLQVSGKDREGNDFVRLSYYNPDLNFRQQAITVEMGLGSEMIMPPNQVSNVYFEVTNNKNYRVFVYFMCRDERRLLRRMQPLGAWLNPRQTVVVTLELFSRLAGAEYRDLLTFTAYTGSERVEKLAALRISSNKGYDNESPHMWHKFTSDCLKVLFGRCEDSSWTIEVTAQDRESGLLQVTSSPKGLYYPRGYTTGTTEEVTGYYSASCCEPIIHLTAVDISNNRRTYVADAYKAALGPGAIAAIVLSIVLLIALIILIICLCKCGKCGKCKCCRKQSDSVDLSTRSYRGPVNSATTSRY